MTALTLRSDRSLIRSSVRSVRYVLLTLEAPVSSGPRTARTPVDVAFVIDRSGSMQGQKLRLAREAVIQGIHMLGPDDRFAVIAYDDEVRVVSALCNTTKDERELAVERVQELREGGSTNLSGGWLTGCMQLADASAPREIRKCLMMSDGQANVGITDVEELAKHAAELRERGIATSTFGIGAGFDEDLMTGMARAGGGQPYFIRTADQTVDLLTSELGETLDVVVRDVVVRLNVPEGVKLELLSDFDLHVGPKGPEIRVGHMVSGQSVSILVQVDCPTGAIGRTLAFAASIASRERGESAWTELAWTYADHAANEQQPRNAEVDAAVVKVDAARARREALRYNRAGEFATAGKTLMMARSALMSRAGDDAEALQDLAALDADALALSAPMPTMAMKAMTFATMSALRSRDELGKAKRSEGRTEK